MRIEEPKTIDPSSKANMSLDRPNDRLDRDAFYSEDSSDDEYEIEPIDEHILAQQKARAVEELQKAKTAIDVDEIYRELDKRDDFDSVVADLRPKFSLKSLLIATAGLALLLGVWQGGLLNGRFFAAMIVLSLIVLGSLHAWLNWREAKLREQLIEKRRRQLARGRGEEDMYSQADETSLDFSPKAWLHSMLPALRFSTFDLLMATLAAGVLLTFVSLLGNLGRVAAAMGAIAVVGFALQALDFHLPRFVILTWWFAMAAFCVLTLVSLIGQGLGLA